MKERGGEKQSPKKISGLFEDESNYCSNKHYLSNGENKAPKKIQALFKMRVIIAVMNTT